MFYIFDSGRKVQTPLDSLLRQTDVQSVRAPAPTRRIDEKDSSTSIAREKIEDAYRENKEPIQVRRRVKFAHEIMTSPVLTGTVDQPLSEIWRIFATHRIHHLPLLDSSAQLRGIVSDRDITRFAANAGHIPPAKRIGELMARRVVTAAPETEVRDLAEVLVSRRIGALPIVTEGGLLAGIVTRTDILHTLVHRAPLELWT